MSKELDYTVERYCPAHERIISADLCYDSLMCLNGSFKISSTKELQEIKDIDKAMKLCKECPYSDLS